MKKKKVFVQKTLFGEDEMKAIAVHKAVRYDAYVQGARDMLLLCLGEGMMQDKRNIRNLPSRYMCELMRYITKDKSHFHRFLQSNKINFQKVASGYKVKL